MRLEMFILMTAGLLIAGWLTHSNTIADNIGLASTTEKDIIACNDVGIDNPLAYLKCPNTILGTLMAVVLVVILGGGLLGTLAQVAGIGNVFSNIGFASMYVLPSFIIIGLVGLEIFIFPLGFLTVPGVSPWITYPVMLIYNSLLIATIVQFVRGS